MADNVAITAGAGTTIATDDLTDAGGAHVQYVKLMDGAANSAVRIAAEPFGALQVNTGLATLLYDAWSSSPIDTTDKWTVTGTAPTIANGNMTMSAALSLYHAIRSKDLIVPNAGFTLVRNGISIETATATGAGRFWGLGTTAITPAPAVLAQNAVGFEIDQATGALLAVTYAAGVRATIATLTRPTDGATHAYGVYFRVTQAYWILDGVQVAAQSFPNVQVAELPALIVRQNAAAFTGTPAFVNIAHLTADTSRQAQVIADPVIGTRMARVTPEGALRTSRVAPTKATYSASVNALAPALTPTDIFTVTGSATRTVKITKIQIDATATAAAVIAVFLPKRSTANAGGTSTAPTRVPLDSTNAAATATVLAYTANPTTLGTLVGNIRQEKLLVSTTTSSGETLLLQFGDTSGSPIVLRGTGEVLAFNLNAVSLAGGSINLFVEWTEE